LKSQKRCRMEHSGRAPDSAERRQRRPCGALKGNQIPRVPGPGVEAGEIQAEVPDALKG
jgi:hypothetical protein